MDTTSNGLARILHLLAQNQDAQDKMRAELMEASETEDIPYDQLVALPFLDAVCRETLRMYVFAYSTEFDVADILFPRYPPVSFLFRE